ncbi:hypothetical protein CYMTET_22311 [Cymbomonas tetramitiformis]|uniref:Uncharacterized protein n=1 Tax=Cymbomonas tetramitiformis TaxID=36881 RepID=A0AAE0G0N9_9CHLO|nr:hypothetical protein CYMTET_22311 [Cymbomonas tetramitiformis]
MQARADPAAPAARADLAAPTARAEPLLQCTHATPCPARAVLGKHENTAQEGVSASSTQGMGSAQAVYAIPRTLLHHLFCGLKLEERMSEESAAAVMDLIATLTAQTDEFPMQEQDTGV